ncbi:dual oxidase maturation factor 1 [Striga asiatica]|uniref:Dual oxidase maturation factor 1 n=1 Tax=Striga asiatica TaxID=4170 RepID=A0A5A7REA3_STRAF|nr:dual oxidase maturation factor 1 [Striga asiatica]
MEVAADIAQAIVFYSQVLRSLVRCWSDIKFYPITAQGESFKINFDLRNMKKHVLEINFFSTYFIVGVNIDSFCGARLHIIGLRFPTHLQIIYLVFSLTLCLELLFLIPFASSCSELFSAISSLLQRPLRVCRFLMWMFVRAADFSGWQISKY